MARRLAQPEQAQGNDQRCEGLTLPARKHSTSSRGVATSTSTCAKSVPAAVDLASKLPFTAVPGTSSCSTRMVWAASSRVGLSTSARGPLPLRAAFARIASNMTA